MRFNNKETDLTQGKIFPQIVAFALPLMLGDLFQQFYNTGDSWVVGNYVGKVSFSAVGTLSPVLNTMIGFFTGFSNGAGVVIAQYYGAGKSDKVHDSVHTYTAITLILCVFFTLTGLVSIPLMIRILNSPSEVSVQQTIYLTIFFAGFSGLLIYNMGAAIMRSVGNSTFPFVLLVICAVSNVILDLLFVIVFHMGTAGVAIATIIAQGVSAVTVIVCLLRTNTQVRIRIKDLKIDREITKRILSFGLPTAIQMSITNFSNVFVQRYINFFGTDVMAGWTAYSKLDQLFVLPMMSIGLATTTFVGQNIGKGDIDRAKHGVRSAMILSLSSTFVLILFEMLAAPQLVSLFISSGESEVIRFGSLFLRQNGIFFLFAAANQVLCGGLRGCGRSKEPMFAMIGSYALFRQLYLFVFTNYISNTIRPVAFSYPAGWILCCTVSFLFFIKLFPKTKTAESET